MAIFRYKIYTMHWAFDITLKNRKLLESFLDFTLAELNNTPKGFNNNIIWNIAHVVVTQQLLIYNLSGLLPPIISNELITRYRKGTKPDNDLYESDIDEIRNLLFTTIEKTQEDYKNNIFQKYNAYTVTTKNTLTNVDEAIEFNNYHKGIHLGVILALRKLV